MKPLRPPSLLRRVLAGLLCLGPLSALAGDLTPDLARRLRSITQDDSLSAARKLLDSPSVQDDWKKTDHESFRQAFASAVELKDIGDLLLGSSDPRAMRLGLRERERCKFCNDPARLEAWFKREASSQESRVKTLREAAWAWECVPAQAKKVLRQKGLDSAAWDRLDLMRRVDHLRSWANGELAAILATTPRTAAELRSLQDRAGKIDGIIDGDADVRLNDRMDRASQAVSGLARAATLAGSNPAMRRALEDARTADLDGMLARLTAIFDGTGENNPALRAAAPPREGQRFDAPSRRELVSSLLKAGLMKETEGTFAGGDLERFYKTNTLDLRVAPTPAGQENTIAWYCDGVISFNEKHIQEYLKAEGKDIKDLSRDPALLRRLSAQLASSFVHEADHQRQEVWARENKLPELPGQHEELEAMQVEALFIVEKRRRDPSFNALLERDRKTSMLAREALSLSDRLARGTQSFRDSINARHYPELLSLEGTTWCQVGWHRRMSEDIEKELARRDALPRADQKRLAAARDHGDLDASEEDWRKSLKETGTPHLKAALAASRGRRENISADYAAYRDRLERVNKETAERLNVVLNDPDPVKSAKTRRGVPPPPAAGKETR